MAGDFVIAIDFGTTYSGAAWCWSGQPDNINLVTRWKRRSNLGGHDDAKVPSSIHYGYSETTWGYDIPEDQEPIKWFKLLLVNESDLADSVGKSAQIRRARELVQEKGKTAVEVVADYLRLLWSHTVDDIIRDRGLLAFEGSRLKVCVTVPAIWQEDARRRMRQAVKVAGILEHRHAGETTLSLVAEPEAAAMAVLDDFRGRKDVEPGDVFVVCDAGGGTVDLISYYVDSTAPLSIKECVEGTGEMCGAIFVDEAFKGLLKLTLVEKWEALSEKAKQTLMNNEWEFGLKRLYDDSNREWSVTVPVEAFQRRSIADRFRRDRKRFNSTSGEVPMRAGQLKLGRDQVRALFKFSVQGTRSLIRQQVLAAEEKCNGKAPKAILLVGGLGSSGYLYSELKKEFEPLHIMVLQPSGPRPWTAICRGAVMRGLNDSDIPCAADTQIISRVSRINYGITFRAISFDETIHDLRDKYWCPKELRWQATGQTQWFLRKGDDVYTKQPVDFALYWHSATQHDLIQDPPVVTIFENSDTTAPRRKSDSVKPLVNITVNADVEFDELPVYVNKEGTTFHTLNFIVQMISNGTDMKWKVLVDGEVQAEQDVRISQA